MAHTTSTPFRVLPLHESLQEALEDLGLSHATPIQALALPRTLTGHDLMGLAQTGTGKTATFLLSLLHYLMVNPAHPKARAPFALVLAPTRELALQIKKDADALGRYTGLRSLAVYGGADINQQKAILAKHEIDVLIGTPGRIIDLYKQKVFKLGNIEVCVLDEADRMFDLGFIDDVRYLLRQMPPAPERLNLLFSATLSQRIQELAYEHFNRPELVQVESEHPTAANVRQRLYHVTQAEKAPLLVQLLQTELPPRTLVFLNTKQELERLAATLTANGLTHAALSGDVAQNQRERIVQEFQRGNIRLLLATDVAGRGLHVPDISHVINYDLPNLPEDYVHRIGRTGRAGASGEAISFACEQYVYALADIEAYIREKIPVQPLPAELPTLIRPPFRPAPRPPLRSSPGRSRPRVRRPS